MQVLANESDLFRVDGALGHHALNPTLGCLGEDVGRRLQAERHHIRAQLGDFSLTLGVGGVYSQRYLRWAVEVVGVERILFATDYPYRPGPDGGWHVELNSDTLPRVLVNQVYYSKLSKTVSKGDDKSYFSDCLQNATWLVRALDQRARTILKVATEIVRQQDGFFTHGVAHLRPLNLKAVADAIQMHESTVSRVTANKYMATNRGIFELKYFFTASIASADGGEAHSAEAVRHHIKRLIDAEDAAAILSDDTIVERLREAGIEIARRTVAKYREAMRIPSSVQRRRDKQNALGQGMRFRDTEPA